MERDFKELDLYSQDYPFRLLVQDVNDGRLNLQPIFQRKYKRDKDGFAKSSKFIESCLMRIPLPVCYFSENKESDLFDVIDGVQRITTIKNFFEDSFALEDLLEFSHLNGKKFSQLDIKQQNDLKNYTIRCVILRRDNPEYIVNDIFARLNQGGVQLSHQEIRNALYDGTFNSLIKELSQQRIIQKFSGAGKDLGDEEMILRFFALKGDLINYDSKLQKHLDTFMIKNQNLSEDKVEQYKSLFLSTINKVINIFGESNAFINPSAGKKKPNIVYYDLLMRYLWDKEDGFIQNEKIKIKKAFVEVCNDESFQKTISGGTAQKGSIMKRREIFNKYLLKYL